jgi:hypothetical protein
MTSPAIADRAAAIVRGLRATGRAVVRRGQLEIDGQYGQYVRIDRLEGGYFWIDRNGERLLRGTDFADLDELQPSFVDAMATAGAKAVASARS